MVEIKTCIKCGKSKILVDFPIRKDSKDGYKNTCKVCISEYLKEYRLNPPKVEIIPDNMKRCQKCKELKTIDNFSKNKKNKDGLKSYCKDCKAKESAAWRKNNPYYAKKYRKEHREELTEYEHCYYKNNRKKLLDKKKEYYINNPEKKEERKKSKHDWYELNKDKVYENKLRRRARKEGVEENYTTIDRKITFSAFNNSCFNCGTKNNLTIDHNRPLIKGNPLNLSNAVVLCKLCNASKATKNPEDFYGVEKCAELDKKLAQINKDNLK